MTTEDRRATAVLARQHRSIDELLEMLVAPPSRGAANRLAAEAGEQIMAHLATEEAVFYPAAQSVLGGRDAERGRHDHLLVRLRLRNVLNASSTGGSLHESATALRRAFLRHVRLEELEVFPYVERALGPEKLRALGEKLGARPALRTVEASRRLGRL
jgi:hemerythrin-like domain-containing protein